MASENGEALTLWGFEMHQGTNNELMFTGYNKETGERQTVRLVNPVIDGVGNLPVGSFNYLIELELARHLGYAIMRHAKFDADQAVSADAKPEPKPTPPNLKERKCNIIPDGVDTHRGEYWYTCTTCGWSDWFAGYTKIDTKTFTPQDCNGDNIGD